MLFLITLGKWSLKGATKWWASWTSSYFSNAWPLDLVLTSFKILQQFIYIPFFLFIRFVWKLLVKQLSSTCQSIIWTWPTLCWTWAAHGCGIRGMLNLRSHFFLLWYLKVHKHRDLRSYIWDRIYFLHAVHICWHVLQPDKHPNYNKCAVPTNLCYTS